MAVFLVAKLLMETMGPAGDPKPLVGVATVFALLRNPRVQGPTALLA